MAKTVLEFLRTEAGGGFLLAIAAVAALIIANSPLAGDYFNLLKATAAVDLGFWRTEATAKDWVKDGLMAVFFYVIGLELKREMTIGELSDPRKVLLPVAAAIGGAAAPVLVYFGLTDEPRGWPVPVATDIAFALAALAVLAPKLDRQARLFLLTLAVVDDLMAIALIAILYTDDLSLAPLLSAAALLSALALAGRARALPLWFYPLAALIAWALAREAGIHTSVMAVAAAAAVPARPVNADETIICRLEHFIHPVSAYFVLPVFAFVAAGVSFAGISFGDVASGPAGAIALALAIGKPLGVTAFTLGAAKISGAQTPIAAADVLRIGCVCGIGFTMSLFIGGLAFAGDDAAESASRLGVLAGSTLSLLLAAAAFRIGPGGR